MRNGVRFGFLAILLAAGCSGMGGGDDDDDDDIIVFPDAGAWSSSDAAPGAPSADGGPGGGSGIDLGGSGDFGYFRRLLDEGMVPRVGDFDAAGFFAEHKLTLPPPTCGERVCLQALLAVMPDLLLGTKTAMLQIGLNTPVTIDPDTRPPLTLSVVVDVSGSMDVAGKIDYVRLALATLIDELEDTDQIALITYSDTASIVAPMGEVGDRRAALHAIAMGLEARGSTNLYAGLEMGYQQVHSVYDLERQNRVILLSDGQPTSGITDESSILAMSASYNSEGMAITTVGLGTAFNATLMRGLAEQGHGNHYFLEDSAAVLEVFTEELSYFTVPVAFDVTLDVRAGSLYDFKRAYGSSFWEDDAEGGGLSVPSVFIAHRVSPSDTTPGTDGEGRRGGGSALLIRLGPKDPSPDPGAAEADVAIIDVSFREPGATELTSATVAVNYPFSPLEIPPSGYWDGSDPAIIHKSFAMLNLYMAIERGCDEFHAGQGTHAIWMLRRVEAAILDYNEELYDGAGDTDMTADLELVNQLIDVMVANGAVPPDSVDIPDDPWPAD